MEKRNHWNIYPPKPITEDAFFELVGYLRNFKQGLNPTERLLTAQIFGERIQSVKTNDDIGSILDPFVIEDINVLKIFVLLRKDQEKSVQTMIEISLQHTHINTSDIGADWGYAVQADINNYLLEKKIVSKAFWLRLNNFLNILKYPFLIVGAVYYILWHFNNNSSYLVKMIGFLVAGMALLFRDFYIFFKPSRPYQAIIKKDKRINISINTIIVILAFLTAVLSLIKEIISIIFSKTP